MTQRVAELFPDEGSEGDIRVECLGEDGEIEVSIFSGPRAMERAMAFANSYYEDWRGIPKVARN